MPVPVPDPDPLVEPDVDPEVEPLDELVVEADTLPEVELALAEVLVEEEGEPPPQPDNRIAAARPQATLSNLILTPPGEARSLIARSLRARASDCRHLQLGNTEQNACRHQ